MAQMRLFAEMKYFLNTKWKFRPYRVDIDASWRLQACGVLYPKLSSVVLTFETNVTKPRLFGVNREQDRDQNMLTG